MFECLENSSAVSARLCERIMCVFQLSFILALVSPCVSDIFTNGITRNLAHPKKSLMGLYTKLDIEKYNNVMIKNVVKLCQIQAHRAILEVTAYVT